LEGVAQVEQLRWALALSRRDPPSALSQALPRKATAL
jgi:hypothetical protein